MDSQFLVKFNEKPGVVAGEVRRAWLGLGPTLQSGQNVKKYKENQLFNSFEKC